MEHQGGESATRGHWDSVLMSEPSVTRPSIFKRNHDSGLQWESWNCKTLSQIFKNTMQNKENTHVLSVQTKGHGALLLKQIETE